MARAHSAGWGYGPEAMGLFPDRDEYGMLRSFTTGPNSGFCRNCPAYVFNNNADMICGYLARQHSGSPTRTALDIASSNFWDDPVGGSFGAFGQEVVARVGKSRPRWLLDSSLEMLAALYAESAKARGERPPVREVFSVDVRTEKTSSGGERQENYHYLIGPYAAWVVPVASAAAPRSLLIEADGRVVGVDEWYFSPGKAFFPEYKQQSYEWISRRAPSGYRAREGDIAALISDLRAYGLRGIN